MAQNPDDREVSDPRLDRQDLEGALHDVSNVLTVLLGWVSEAREGGAPEEIKAHALAMIEQRARIACDLARRAIGVSSPVINGEEPLEAVLADVLGALEVLAQRSGVRFERGKGSAGTFVPEASDLAQVLTNLLMNALAWAPRGSRITLDVAPGPEDVAIDVKDEGPGIEASRAAAIFGGVSTRRGGAGVGLRHARDVARSAGGDLILVTPSPTDPERGARLRLTWPRADAVVPKAPASTPQPPVLAGTRVLVLEDDHEVATLLETALGARGADVTVTKSEKELGEATKPATHGGFDAALIDLSPLADRVEVTLERLRRTFPEMTMVVISGSVGGEGLPSGEASQLRWVRKPFEIPELVAALLDARAEKKNA